MNLQQRVRKLEDYIGGTVLVPCVFIFGGVYYGDCKRHQDGRCQLIGKSGPLAVPSGAKIEFVPTPHGPKETNPCDGCADFEKGSVAGGPGK